jgi:hypothetical protein
MSHDRPDEPEGIDEEPEFAYRETTDMYENDPLWIVQKKPEAQKLIITSTVVETTAPPPPPLTIANAIATPSLSSPNPDGAANTSSSSEINRGQAPDGCFECAVELRTATNGASADGD